MEGIKHTIVAEGMKGDVYLLGDRETWTNDKEKACDFLDAASRVLKSVQKRDAVILRNFRILDVAA